MCKLERMLVEALEEWKRTGRLPSGEYWQPADKENDVTEEAFRNCINGIQVKSFYEVICSKANIPKKAARSALLHLEKEGFVKIVWHSPRGARFYPVKKLV